MPIQMISYDLRRPGQDYTGLFEAIQVLWYFVALPRICLAHQYPDDKRAGPRRAQFPPNAGDSLLVAALGGNWATVGLPKNCTDWLRQFVAA